MEIFLTGGTGYIGSRLIPALIARGHKVRALVRRGSENKLAPGAEYVSGDPLMMGGYTSQLRAGETFIHLIGTPHPSPAKVRQFQEIDLVSIQVAVDAARAAGVKHFVYLSVAHPASMMKAFIEVRMKGEELVRASGIPATFVRPWYVLGPGHLWPYALLPVYWIMRQLPASRDSARRLGLVTILQMIRTLVWAVENPPSEIQILDVSKIHELGRTGLALKAS